MGSPEGHPLELREVPHRPGGHAEQALRAHVEPALDGGRHQGAPVREGERLSAGGRRRDPSPPPSSAPGEAPPPGPLGRRAVVNLTAGCSNLRALAQRQPARALTPPPSPVRPTRGGAPPNLEYCLHFYSSQSNLIYLLAVAGSAPPGPTRAHRAQPGILRARRRG